MDTEKRELWDRSENEPVTAYHAFESFLTHPSVAGTGVAAYRCHVGNLEAVKPSDTWGRSDVLSGLLIDGLDATVGDRGE
jgi:hypothetical protein